VADFKKNFISLLFIIKEVVLGLKLVLELKSRHKECGIFFLSYYMEKE